MQGNCAGNWRPTPLTVLPASATGDQPLTATGAQLVGNYAVRIIFSDGHDTGLYSWDYLREIDPGTAWDASDEEV